jgi:hypothetical protein
LLPARLIVVLKAFFDTVREKDYGLSLRMMVSERRLSPKCTQECSASAINSRVFIGYYISGTIHGGLELAKSKILVILQT